ncbi:MAG: hypothetical protein N2556_04010 [Anaerolineae bacterium]|nr:hypothetical protein [Anaerolineae bacterium]
MLDEERFLKTVDRILSDDRLSNFQRWRILEDLSKLAAAPVETNASPSQLSLVKRKKSILIAISAYYNWWRRIKDAVRWMYVFLSNLENLPRTRSVKEVFEQLLWYWQLEPEQEIRHASYTLEVRLLVQQTRHRLMRYRDAVIGFTVGSVALLMVDKPLVEYVYLRVQSGVSPLEVILFHIGIFVFVVSLLSLALGFYYYALYVLHALHMLTQFRPPNQRAG